MRANFLETGQDKADSSVQVDHDSPNRFFNRELSWLDFNSRVLEESLNPQVPLLERLRFLSISASNLDEFYSVRVAGLRELVREGQMEISVDGLSPAQQLEQINERAIRLMQDEQASWQTLRSQMEAAGIVILSAKDIDQTEYKKLAPVFEREIFPVLTPLAIDPAHPFPFIPHAGFALALKLSDTDEQTLQALLPVPMQLPRFIRLQSRGDRIARFLPLEDMLEVFIDQLFPGHKLLDRCAFRVLRDSDLEVEEEAEDLVRVFETALKRRRRGVVVRMELSQHAAADLRATILEEMGVSADDVLTIDGLIGMSNLAELVLPERTDLLWPKFTPRQPERVVQFHGDIFATVRHKDMLLHHPYESFDVVVRFIQQAARDPDVVAIKQTLYRTSRNSPIVSALCEAAESGKSVTALVELKARFDEAANIRLSRQLERSGAQVVYGFIDWKTHAKISTVVRREEGHLVTYSHFGTGNYHPGTANIYTDLSLFTCDADLGHDATRIFNYVSGYARPDALRRIFIAPLTLKSQLIEHIRRERDNARAGKPAGIWAKLNSLVEPTVIDALYEASEAGVPIELVVRGICGLRPGIAGLSSNIRVKSIVGRFLEHSRIVCFANGHTLPSAHARVYISSADWMQRNLNRRVETLVPIDNPTVHKQILNQVMAANLADEANSWVLRPDGEFVRATGEADAVLFSCHRHFMEHPSLSGRGTAGGHEDVPPVLQSRSPKKAEAHESHNIDPDT